MKLIVCGLIGLMASSIAIFYDVQLVKYIFSILPTSLGTWTELIKVGIVLVDIWATAGICVLPFLGCMAIWQILERGY